jgi:hypothetical protein
LHLDSFAAPAALHALAFEPHVEGRARRAEGLIDGEAFITL